MAEPALRYEKDGHIAVVTMNRPEARNAVNPEMLCRLADAWEDVNADPEIRVAILTGAGEQAFCAGAPEPVCLTLTVCVIGALNSSRR